MIGKNVANSSCSVASTSSNYSEPEPEPSGLAAGDMILTNMEKYHDEWPQVAQVVNINDNDDNITVQWYKGSISTSWLPCTIPVPGQRGKRMPWKEQVKRDDIWLSKYKLTNKNCLPKYVKQAIEQYEIN